MLEKKDIVVVIPIYNPNLSENDRISLDHATKVLSDYPLVVIHPEGMETEGIKSLYPLLKFKALGADWFKSVYTYNKMCLASEFYDAFSEYVYMFIYQLDALVFRDELLMWANKGYDYVGAPFTPTNPKKWVWYKTLLYSIKFNLRMTNGKRPHGTNSYRVGNGGLCLRKISRMLEITIKYKDKIADAVTIKNQDGVEIDVDATKNSEGNWIYDYYPEDQWLLYELRGKEALRKPHWKEAMMFCVQDFPEKCFEVTGGKLPFGAHYWPRHKAFWSKYFIK